jgi:TRAP-type C4-dicarboxylate transport system substrate-binding protein
MAGGLPAQSKASPQRQWRTDNDTREREMKTPDLKRLLQTTRNLHRPVARRVDRIVCIAACAIALIVGMLPVTALAQTQWKMATEYPASNISGVGLATFGQLLSAETHGSLTTANGFDNELKISSGEMLQAAQDHRIDGGDAFAGLLESFDPIFGLPSLPFVVQSIDAARAVNARGRPLYARALAARGLKLLYITIWPATGIWSDQPLRNEEDLRTLLVRTYDSSSAEVMRALGATAEFLPFNEAIAKVKEHKLNAILTSGDGGAGRRLWEDLRHFTPINYAIPISIAFVRQDDFDALPKEMQDQVEAAAGETEKSQLELLANRTEENYKRMRASGVSIDEPAPSAIIAALKKAGSRPIAAWQTKVSPEAVAILDWANRQ